MLVDDKETVVAKIIKYFGWEQNLVNLCIVALGASAGGYCVLMLTLWSLVVLLLWSRKVFFIWLMLQNHYPTTFYD